MIGRLEQNILPSYHTKKPVPAILSNHRGEPFFLVSRFHPICRIHFSCEKCRSTTSLDDNGITGPDWGHSEVVFRCFPIRRFQHFTSLSEMFHILLFSSSCSLSLMSESGLLRTRRSGVLTPDNCAYYNTGTDFVNVILSKVPAELILDTGQHFSGNIPQQPYGPIGSRNSLTSVQPAFLAMAQPRKIWK